MSLFPHCGTQMSLFLIPRTVFISSGNSDVFENRGLEIVTFFENHDLEKLHFLRISNISKSNKITHDSGHFEGKSRFGMTEI